MTITFDKFLSQFNSSGRQRLEGFDKSHFEGMTPSEMAQAESMLEQEAKGKSLVAIDALGTLASERAVAILVDILNQIPATSAARVEVLASLWRATQDVAYQNEIAKAIKSSDAEVRSRAVSVLTETTLGVETFVVFWELLKSEQNFIIRSEASIGVLRCFGLITNPYDTGQAFLHITRRLVSQDAKLRDEALEEVRVLASSKPEA
jgi:hypothetical protein